jgi:hypothetical protein
MNGLTAAGRGALVLLALAAAGCPRSQPAKDDPFIFLEPVNYHVGLNPTSLTAADLNGDERLDFLTTNSSSNNVSVLLGRGPSENVPLGEAGGAFREHVMYDVGLRPRAAALADLNHDGRLDLAVANNQSDDLSLLLGNGDGTFRKATTQPLGRSPMAIATGDLNHDGNADLLVALRFDHILILLGKGDGTVVQTANLDPGDTPTALLVDDFNGDTHPDVMVSNNGPMTSSVTVFNGDGLGALRLGARYVAKSRPIFVATGRLNQDAHPDLVAATPFDNSVLLLMGDGRGGFLEPPTQLSGEVEPVAVAVGDFNADGKNDLAVANTGSSDISILLGEGDGRFPHSRLYRANSRPMALIAADLNGDGISDLAVVNNSSNDISILTAIPQKPSN